MHDTQDARHVGPTQPFSDELHQQKYRSEGESFREAMNREIGRASCRERV